MAQRADNLEKARAAVEAEASAARQDEAPGLNRMQYTLLLVPALVVAAIAVAILFILSST